MNLINLGCGRVFHPEWVNVDVVPTSPVIIAGDVSRMLSFCDSSFDVTYSSHVLEHLNQCQGIGFLHEQKRLLRPGGVIRVVVPDLEVICRNYLICLEQPQDNVLQTEFRYHYSLLELFDQMARETPGGELMKTWARKDLPDLDFVLQRHGFEAINAIKSLQSASQMVKRAKESHSIRAFVKNLKGRLKGWLLRSLWGDSAEEALKVGCFRMSGECHKWMYDRISLSRLLLQCGFSNIKVCTYLESRIPEFSRYELDSIQGKPRKPDSLYMEAEKGLSF